MTEKIEGLQEQFTQSILQSRSSNLFLSKFAQFKVGMIGQLLSRLGFTVEDLEKLKKHAIEGGKTENIKSMQENIYNQELSNLIAGGGKKTKKAQAMFLEVQSQLIAQMTLLGNEDYWNNQRLMEEQISQCYKILEEFNSEKKALEYQVNMRGQTLVVEDLKRMPDEKSKVSIKLSDESEHEYEQVEVEEEKQVTIKDIQAKLDKLDSLIKRVEFRIDRLVRDLDQERSISKIEKQKLKEGMALFDLDNSDINI